ncbi:MAG TPA: AraC family transcriptional regulator [Ginsengibacter sp.]
MAGKSTKIDPLTPALFKAKFVWRMGVKAPGFSNDIEMLEKARQILVSDFENIPTIKQLARKVGTNDFKLKKGFRQYFGSSIFAYVQDVRLENARKLLMETDHTITDIAYMTGYDHCNNFSVAFRRKFGVGVKGFRKQK